MIRSTFRTPIAPEPANPPPPRSARSVGRIIYLMLVVGFALYVVLRLVGHLIVIDAVGLVTSDRFVIGAAYTAKVVQVKVSPGERVHAGQNIARLESTEVLASLAQLTQNLAVLEAQREAIIKRQRVVESIIPVAERRLAVAREGEKRLEYDTGRGAVTQNYRSAVLADAFEAERDLATLKSEHTSSQVELARISNNLEAVRNAIEATRRSYAEGALSAPVSGTVSTQVASPGEVLTAGEPVMELLSGGAYVLAYLANGRLYSVSPGDRVILTDGVKTADARIERVDSVADNLPIEFRTAFGANERQEIMRVRTENGMPFPYLSRVKVVSPWSFAHLFSKLKAGLSERR